MAGIGNREDARARHVRRQARAIGSAVCEIGRAPQDDKLTPADPYARLWSSSAPNATATTLEGAGHMVPVEAGPAAAESILRFLG